MNREKKLNIFIYISFFLVYFFLVWNTLGNPPWEVGDNWRQADTFSVAIDYSRNGINLMRPRFFYYGKEPVQIQLELMLLPAIGTLISKFTSFEPFIFRCVSATAYVGSAIFLFKFLCLHRNKKTAILGGFLYLLLPFGLFYGRTIMPESMALFAYMGAFYFLRKWQDDKKYSTLFFSAIFMGIALLQKLSLGFLGIVPIGILLKEQGIKAFIKKEAYTYGIFALVIPLLYYYLVGLESKDQFVSQILNSYILQSQLNIEESLSFIYNSFIQAYTFPVMVLSLLGFIYTLYKKDLFYFLWFLSLSLSMYVIFSGIRLVYYLIFWMPFLITLTSEIIGNCKKKPILILSILLIYIWTGIRGMDYLEMKTKKDPLVDPVVKLMMQYIPKDSYIACNGENPVLLSATGHCGVRIPLTGKETKEDFEKVYKDGLDYYVFLKVLDLNDEIRASLQENSRVIVQDKNCVIFKMEDRD